MSYFKEEELNSSGGFIFVYSGISPQKMEQLIDLTMLSQGYIHLGKGIYEYGSRTKRLLFGGFYKYFKFKVTLDTNNPSGMRMGLQKESTGISGGVLGVKRINSELTRLKEIFSQL